MAYAADTFPDLFAALQPGDGAVLAGAAGTGKTRYAMDVARHHAQHRGPVVFCFRYNDVELAAISEAEASMRLAFCHFPQGHWLSVSFAACDRACAKMKGLYPNEPVLLVMDIEEPGWDFLRDIRRRGAITLAVVATMRGSNGLARESSLVVELTPHAIKVHKSRRGS